MEFRFEIPGFVDIREELAAIRLDIRRLRQLVLAQGAVMSQELDTLTAEVTNNTAVDQSAVTLIKGLADQITALKNDPAALQALADSLHSSSADLAAAVAANTPSAPPAVTPPPA